MVNGRQRLKPKEGQIIRLVRELMDEARRESNGKPGRPKKKRPKKKSGWIF